MDIVAIIAAIMSGTAAAFAAAWIARLLLPGEQRVKNLGLILIGSVVGFITGIVVGLFDIGSDEGINWWSFGISIALSMVGVFIIDRWKSNMVSGLKTPKPPVVGASSAKKPGLGSAPVSPLKPDLPETKATKSTKPTKSTPTTKR